MPTGLTAAINDDCTFEQFAWHCARSMSVLAAMRDEPMNAPIPERFEPSDYHAKKIAELQAERFELERLTPEEGARRAAAEVGDIARRHDDGSAQKEQLAAKYRAMLARVRAWEPPTADHVGLKRLMIEQIEESIRFDCGSTYQEPTPPLSGPEWIDARRDSLARELAYHTEKNTEEVQRTESRNEWIRQLRASVPQP